MMPFCNVKLEISSFTLQKQILKAMENHIICHVQLMGKYKR